MKAVAKVISIVFHPVFVLTYMVCILLLINPYMFGYSRGSEADVLILMVFLGTAFIPIVAVFMMKGLGLIESLQMKNKQERIGPYIVTGMVYLALYMQIVRANGYPVAFQICTLGAIIALFASFFVNNFRKVSMHAVAMGGIVSMAILGKRYYSPESFSFVLPGSAPAEVNTMLMLYAVIFVAGAVCTSRLILKRHTIKDIYGGFVIGFFTQLIAYLILQ